LTNRKTKERQGERAGTSRVRGDEREKLTGDFYAISATKERVKQSTSVKTEASPEVKQSKLRS
jgi:hypothetical protein